MNELLLATVHGWFPPEPHDKTDVSNKTTLLLVGLRKHTSPCREPNPCSCNFHWCPLPGSHAPTARSTLFPHSSLRAGWICSITSYTCLTFASLISRLGIEKVELILHVDHPVQLSPRLLLPGWGAAVQPLSMFILRYYCSAHSPRIETHSPRLHPPAIMWTSPASPPSLAPSLSSSSCRPACLTLNPH